MRFIKLNWTKSDRISAVIIWKGPLRIPVGCFTTPRKLLQTSDHPRGSTVVDHPRQIFSLIPACLHFSESLHAFCKSSACSASTASRISLSLSAVPLVMPPRSYLAALVAESQPLIFCSLIQSFSFLLQMHQIHTVIYILSISCFESSHLRSWDCGLQSSVESLGQNRPLDDRCKLYCGPRAVTFLYGGLWDFSHTVACLFYFTQCVESDDRIKVQSECSNYDPIESINSKLQ